MKSQVRDRGAVTLAVVAPILAAIIGGGAAVASAFQIVNLAQNNSASTGPAATTLSNDTNEVQYGNR